MCLFSWFYITWRFLLFSNVALIKLGQIIVSLGELPTYLYAFITVISRPDIYIFPDK